MSVLMTYMTGFGLAAGAGGRAAMVLFAIGAFHHTQYFELSPEFAWIASAPVMVILGIAAALEALVDLHPDLSEFGDMAGKFTSLVAGVIAFAAVVGSVDSDILHLAGSGVLGAGTAASTRYVRDKVRDAGRDLADATHDSVHIAGSALEAGTVLGVSTLAFVMPLLALLGVVVGVGCAFLWLARRPRHALCPGCGKPIRIGALRCPHCQRNIATTHDEVSA